MFSFFQPIVGDIPPYQSAITELDLLSTKYSPMEKLEVIRRSFEKIHEVKEFDLTFNRSYYTLFKRCSFNVSILYLGMIR